ncbi:MAG: GNAT family N-acetyltransferase [Flavobacteriaceae bacterium]|nr:GNAT family N-acetyltransferase [Flavobacteriaceae bacterium]
MENLLIRKATVDDAKIVAVLAQITFDETFGHHFRDRNDLTTYFDNTFSVAKIRSSISKENNVFWLAFENEMPIGYAKLKKHSPIDEVADKNCAQLQKIYLRKDYLNQQIGGKLQLAMFEEAIQIGKETIWLSVLKTNYRALQFYTKHGFITVGEHLFSIGKETFDFHIVLKSFNE